MRYSWTKEDYEIFDLVSDLEAAEGLWYRLSLVSLVSNSLSRQRNNVLLPPQR